VNLLFYILAGLFVVKLIWNMGVPIDIFIRTRRGQIKPGSGVSLMLPVEVALLVMLFICSFFLKHDSFFYQPVGVLIIGGGGIIFSYVWIFLMLIILRRKKNEGGDL